MPLIKPDIAARPNKTILIVDDEALLREILRELFQFDPVDVLEAENGRDAFDLITAKPVDVVITDARMPGGDGPTLIRAVHALPEGPGKPRMFLCSGFTDLSEAEARALGVRQVFVKPYDLGTLRDVVLKHL